MDQKNNFVSQMKVEMKTLNLSDASRLQVRETLEFLRGMKFSIKEQSAYKDRGTRLEGQYWIGRGNLEVKGCLNFSDTDGKAKGAKDHVNIFAINKLLRYGFYKQHCVEALALADGDVGQAYELLMTKYFSVSLPEPKPVPDELLEERSNELQSLCSIYDNCCEERIANQLWVVNLNLPYFEAFYPGRRHLVSSSLSSHRQALDRHLDKNICRFFLRGHCKFSSERCRFSHNLPEKKTENKNAIVDPDKLKFQLEVRFPAGCHYPLEKPLVSFVAACEEFPRELCLQLTERMLEVAGECASREQACLYELVSLLMDRPEEIEALTRRAYSTNCDPSEPLFCSPSSSQEPEVPEEHLSPSSDHVSAPRRTGPSSQQILREDNILIERFQSKIKQESYKRMLERRKALPAWSQQDDILRAIDQNQVVVISGDTGCGKSTQVPQFILDDWLLHKRVEHVEVICTQPRRISAIGVADRVASERIERVGLSVGYQIRLENKVSSSTRLTFCTMGILLRRLSTDFELSGVSHVIVDEVHERSEESDFLLLILRDVMKVRKDLKVILMSATLNPQVFCDYFGRAPIIEIPGRTFPVEQLFMEDILQKCGYVLEEYSQFARKISKKNSLDLENMEEEMATADQMSMDSLPNPMTRDELLTIKQLFTRYRDYSYLVKKNIYLTDVEKIDNEMIESVLTWIVNGQHNYPREGSILVFLPGYGEIRSLYDELSEHPIFSPRYGKFDLIPLHSSLTNEEQSLVFRKSRPGVRKIILSTNIAETSITIDDCVFVVDTGKKKEKMFDNNKNMESLDTVWVSRANALQRKGRAGRVMPGVCIHLFTRQRFEWCLRAQPIPEIQRVPLEQLILRIKLLVSLKNKDIFEVLDATIEPPERANVAAAITRLQNVGALEKDNRLTALGHHLASLPVDVRIGKFLLMGTMLCSLDSTLTVAAALSFKSPFIAPFNKKEEANARRKEFITGHSDHLTILKAYNKWRQACLHGRYAGNQFANNNYLSNKTLSSMTEIKFHLLELLMDIGFVPGDIHIPKKKGGVDRILELTGPELNSNSDNQNLLASIMCAALYPNVVKVLTPEKQYAQSISGAIPMESSTNEIKFKTKEDGYVFIHPQSVNHNVTRFPNPYLVYQEKVKTSKIFIRDCTVVPALPLVLFSASKIKVELYNGVFVIALDDGWIMFSVSNNEVAELLECIKQEFLSLLDEKINNPSMNLQGSPKGKKIVSTIVQLVTKG